MQIENNLPQRAIIKISVEVFGLTENSESITVGSRLSDTTSHPMKPVYILHELL